jgi:cell division inhibitor SulA
MITPDDVVCDLSKIIRMSDPDWRIIEAVRSGRSSVIAYCEPSTNTSVSEARALADQANANGFYARVFESSPIGGRPSGVVVSVEVSWDLDGMI